MHIYNILEVANTHGGDLKYIYSLLDEFKEFNKKEGFGIKFQPFKYNKIAIKEFRLYETYKELYIDEKQWNKIIDKAYKTKDVWIDIFDEYGILIVQENLDKIFGIKLQTSILDNIKVFDLLKTLNLSDKKIIINIAGREKKDINRVIGQYSTLDTKELLLEIGFQSYPTKLGDSGLSKIRYLQENYDYKIVFADHSDGGSKHAIQLPLMASVLGVDYIEKHIMHSKLETKYDYFSSITYEKYKELIKEQNIYLPLLSSDFINSAELQYLFDGYQVPLLKKESQPFKLLDYKKDFIFRRSDSKGLNINQIKKLIENYYILCAKKDKNAALKKEDFKKANIAVIIACRLKSSRLSRKALLKTGKLTSIELCIRNALKIRDINHVVLATSNNYQDQELSNYTYNDSVVFHQGEPNDVISRYLDIIEKLKIDVVVRVTGDMPYVSSDISDYLLKKHFESGADYTVASEFSVGTSVEIINSSALKKVKEYFPYAEYSEYMTWYFQNNSEYFDLNYVDIPKKWIRKYRLTLDYQEDLELFNCIENYFIDNNIDYSIEELYKFLDLNPDISSLNRHLSQKYETDLELIKLLDSKTKIKEYNTPTN